MWLSISKDQLEAGAAMIMRVPGLFIIDHWWLYYRNKSIPNSVDSIEILNAIITNLVLLHGFLLLLLPISNVKTLYTHFESGALVVISHLISSYYVANEGKNDVSDLASRDENFYKRHIAMLAYHGLSAALVSYLIPGSWKPFPPMLGCYVLPVVARLADFPVDSLQVLHNFSSAAMAFNGFLYITYQVPSVIDYMKVAYWEVVTTFEDNGIVDILTVLWDKLFVPNHFLLFWVITFIDKFSHLIYYPQPAYPWDNKWYSLILMTISSLCASPVSLIATSVGISYLSFFVLCGTKSFLLGQFAFFTDNPMHSGWTEGLSLILLAIQTGLIEAQMPGRSAIMIIILFIVLSSLLQSVLEITEPVVLSFSASRNRSLFQHFRALLVCLMLLIFPLYLSWVLSQIFPIDFWMLVVLSSCMLTSVQVIDLLVVHSLFLYDSKQSETWENLDDVVYYTRAITKVLEFFIAVFVVGMGLWESASNKWTLLNGFILVVHCYFNVWQRLQKGWRSFLLRQEAAKKSESLPAADELQLSQLDDVCSICFSRMRSACITPCQHFFHRTCLRKWLYVQDKCPLCQVAVSNIQAE